MVALQRFDAVDAEVHGLPFAGTMDAAWRIFRETAFYSGGTFNPADGEPVKVDDGFAVAGFADGITLECDVDNLTYRDGHRIAIAIGRYIERMPLTINGTHHYHLGTWIDNGILHIDSVKIIPDADLAIRYALRNNQLAIYNFNTKNCIRVP